MVPFAGFLPARDSKLNPKAYDVTIKRYLSTLNQLVDEAKADILGDPTKFLEVSALFQVIFEWPS